MQQIEGEKPTTDKLTDEEVIAAFNKAMTARKIVIRPKFYLKKECLQIIATAVMLAALLISVNILFDDISFWITILAVILFLLSQLKNLLLTAIFLYQKFAPEFVRSSCLFKPSCSEYMRLSVLKYGAFKGVKKGLNRLCRCHPPNGGIDEP